MRVHIVFLSCLVLLQAIPIEKKFLQLNGNDGDVEITADNLQVVEKEDTKKDVQLLAAEDSDLMINQLEPLEEAQSLDDETPLNSAYFEGDGNSDLIEDASQNIVEDLQVIGQNDANNNVVDENHQVIDTQQNIENSENFVDDNLNVNDEIQQEISDQQGEITQESQDQQEQEYQNDQVDNQVETVDTLQVVDDGQQQQLISQSNEVLDLTNMDQDQINAQFSQPEFEAQPDSLEETNKLDDTIIVDNQQDTDKEQTVVVAQEATVEQNNTDNSKEDVEVDTNDDVQVETEADPNDPGQFNEDNEVQQSCIELYSQCYYKGESMKACNDLGLMKDFPYDIKSLKIPYGTSLTIYDHPNYEGEKHTFSSSEECLTDVVVLTQIAI